MSYRPLLPPRAHQLEARSRMRAAPLPHFALLMEMGTGKSKVVVDEFGERVEAGDVSDLVIVAPAGCYRNWLTDREGDPGEVRKHMDPAVHERVVSAQWISGGGEKNLAPVRSLLLERERPRILSINCEALVAVEKARQAVSYFVAHSRRGVLFVVDESTIIKGDSQRTAIITDLGRRPNVAGRRILTGLATPNSPLDLYWQFDFLDPRILGFRMFETFKRRYAIMQRMSLPPFFQGRDGQVRQRRRQPEQVVAYKNEAELTEKIMPHSFRKLKVDCLDLPPKQYLPIRWVDFHPEQRRVYHEIKAFATARLESETYVTATMVLAQRLRLDQVLCGHVMDEEGVLREIPERRTDALLEVLQETQGKVIVWTSHDYCVRKIGDKLRKEFGPQSVAQFWGGNRATRHVDEGRFKGDPRCRFMVATQAAGGRGNTWTMAGLSVYYNNTDNLEHRLQSEDRTHRDGLAVSDGGAGRADYLDLAVPNTIDLRKIQNLRKKLSMATLIAGDPHQDWLI